MKNRLILIFALITISFFANAQRVGVLPTASATNSSTCLVGSQDSAGHAVSKKYPLSLVRAVLPFINITGLPSTIAGYGITNAYTKAQVDSEVLANAGTAFSAATSYTWTATQTFSNILVHSISGTSGTPTIAAVGNGAGGIGTPTMTVTGNDLAGVITITTTTLCGNVAPVATITFHTTLSSAPIVLLSNANDNATAIPTIFVPFSGPYATTVAAFNIYNQGAPALSDNTTYRWYYHVLK